MAQNLSRDERGHSGGRTARHELKAYLRRQLDTFINPLVYTLRGNQGPSIMTMSALAE
jgi:hypothetical protein